MNNSPIITPEEWERIQKYIADGPDHVHLVTDENGTYVAFNGELSGIIHPRAYLQLMEEDEATYYEPFDILKHVSNASDAKLSIDHIMPGSLSGANVTPWKPPKD